MGCARVRRRQPGSSGAGRCAQFINRPGAYRGVGAHLARARRLRQGGLARGSRRSPPHSRREGDRIPGGYATAGRLSGRRALATRLLNRGFRDRPDVGETLGAAVFGGTRDTHPMMDVLSLFLCGDEKREVRHSPVVDIPVKAKGDLAVAYGGIYYGALTTDRVYVAPQRTNSTFRRVRPMPRPSTTAPAGSPFPASGASSLSPMKATACAFSSPDISRPNEAGVRLKAVTNILYPTQGPVRPSRATSDTPAPVSHPSDRRDRSRRGDR